MSTHEESSERHIADSTRRGEEATAFHGRSDARDDRRVESEAKKYDEEGVRFRRLFIIMVLMSVLMGLNFWSQVGHRQEVEQVIIEDKKNQDQLITLIQCVVTGPRDTASDIERHRFQRTCFEAARNARENIRDKGREGEQK